MHDDDIFACEQSWFDAGTARKDQPIAFSTTSAAPTPEASRFFVDWVDQQYETTQPPDPTYPNGTAIDVAMDAPRACRIELPCPAPRCGLFVITCRACGYSIALATAGRADDPRTVRMPCRRH